MLQHDFSIDITSGAGELLQMISRMQEKNQKNLYSWNYTGQVILRYLEESGRTALRTSDSSEYLRMTFEILCDDLLHHIPVDIRQPEIAAGVAVGQLLVIQAEQRRIVACRSWMWILSVTALAPYSSVSP